MNPDIKRIKLFLLSMFLVSKNITYKKSKLKNGGQGASFLATLR